MTRVTVYSVLYFYALLVRAMEDSRVAACQDEFRRARQLPQFRLLCAALTRVDTAPVSDAFALSDRPLGRSGIHYGLVQRSVVRHCARFGHGLDTVWADAVAWQAVTSPTTCLSSMYTAERHR